VATTDTSICNSALIKVGSKSILSLDDDSKEGRICKEQYPKLRDEVQESHPWNFCIRRADTLSPLAQAPVQINDFVTQQFELPNDTLRVLGIDAFPSEINWVVEDGKLLTDTDTIKLRYIARVTDTSKFSATFSEALAWRIAADLAYSLAQNRALAESMFVAYERQLSLARAFDAQENGLTRLRSSFWTGARRRRGSP